MYDAPGEFRGLSTAACLSRVSSNSARTAVPVHKLPATSVPRANLASARVSVLTSDNVGICLDNEYTAAYGGRQFVNSDRCCRD